MDKNGPIVLIDDDSDDLEIFTMAFSKLNYPNEFVAFSDPYKALTYLERPDVFPFIVISDINMPRLSGFELRNIIFSREELKVKCIPYLFLTTATVPQLVLNQYALSVQGFFKKPSSIQELEILFRQIMEYWHSSIYPG